MRRQRMDETSARLLLFLAVVSIVVSVVSLFTVLSAVAQVESGALVDSSVAEGYVSLTVTRPDIASATGGVTAGNVLLNVVENKDKRGI